MAAFQTLRIAPARGAFRRLSYQSRLQACGCDPGHHQLPRHLRTAWFVMPTLVFLQLELPSSAALVARLSRATQGWASTTSHHNQDTRAFPPARRFLLARLRADPSPPRSWAGVQGLLGLRRISPEPRPRTVHAAFTAHGANKQIPSGWRPVGVEAGGLREHCAPCDFEWLWSGWRPADARCTYIGGPPNPPGSVCRTRSPCLLVPGYAAQARVLRVHTPPSSDVVADRGYHVVDRTCHATDRWESSAGPGHPSHLAPCTLHPAPAPRCRNGSAT